MTQTASRPLAIPAAFGLAFIVLPLIGLLLRAPWSRLGEVLDGPSVVPALQLSLVTSVIATAISVVLGVPLAWLLARLEGPVSALVHAVVTLPLVLPPVVGGVALLTAFGRLGFVGRWLDQAFGLTLPFTPAAVVLAETFVAMPFLVVTVEGALRTLDPRYSQAARTLGASSWTAFRRVTIPLVGPSLIAGAVLTWARALGEFGATITFAGNFPGRTQTMPIAIYLAMERDPDAAIALSVVLMLVCVVLLVVLRRRWWGGVG